MNYEEQLLDEEKVFKDPVHRYVRVKDQIIWDLIATPEFQRLRRVKQLGTTNLTFHGAEHSRFNHSLGVYEIVRRMIRNMEKYRAGTKVNVSFVFVLPYFTTLGMDPSPIHLKKYLVLITKHSRKKSFLEIRK